MTCNKCGKELAAGTKKCDGCGKKVKVKFSDLPKKQKTTRIVIACVCFLIAVVLVFGGSIGGASRAGDASSDYITAIKEGTFSQYPEQQVGTAFESFFSDPEWKSFTSAEGEIIVEFNGGCTWGGEDANCCIQFVILEDGTFETYYADVNGNPLTDNDIIAMYDVIYGVESTM
ncbi:MAG: hypothetical protein IJ261_02455, partial [Clostridia bacterium]|nr:hypothetical protein [Clostridia bacterium]